MKSKHYRTKYKSSSLSNDFKAIMLFFLLLSRKKNCKPYLTWNNEGFMVFWSVLKNEGSGRGRRARKKCWRRHFKLWSVSPYFLSALLLPRQLSTIRNRAFFKKNMCFMIKNSLIYPHIQLIFSNQTLFQNEKK